MTTLPDIFTDDDDDYSSIDPDVIRTIIGEGDPAFIASVLANRKKKSKLDYGTLIRDAKQFSARTGDAWSKNSKITEDSPEYQRTLGIAGPILTGKKDPATEADSFYSPKDNFKADWDDGKGVTGPDGQLYFKDQYVVPKVSPVFTDEEGLVDPEVTNSATGEQLTPQQTKTARQLQMEQNGLVIDPKTGDATYKSMPLYQSSGTEEPQKQGDYWIAPSGVLHQVPVDANAATTYANGVLLGTGNKLMAGIQALKESGGNPNDPMFGNYYDQALSHYTAGQQAYTQEHPTKAGVAQNVGNLQTLIPAMALGGEALTPVRAALGPTGEFLAGTTKGNKFLQLGSQAANGAVQGAAAAGLTSNQSEQPLGHQLFEGALAGGVFGPIANSVGSAINKIVNPYISQPVRDLANKAINKFNYDLRGSQILGDEHPTMASTDARLVASSGSDYAKNAADQATTRMRNISNTFGEDTDTLTRPALQSAQTRIGGDINTIASRNNITNVQDLKDNINTVISGAKLGGLTAPEQKQLSNLVSGINKNIVAGQITGKAYKGLITSGSPLYDAMHNSSSNINLYAKRIKGALDDAFDAEAIPGDAEAMKKARAQYGNLMNVQRVVDAKGKVPIGALDAIVGPSSTDGRLNLRGDLSDINDIDNLFLNHKVTTNDSWLSKAGHFTLPGLATGTAGAALAAKHPVLAGEIIGGSLLAGGVNHYLNTPISELLHNNPFIKSRMLSGTTSSLPRLPVVPVAAVAARNKFNQ